ncbi:hypothetical protein SLE2022_106000 [Rubroshorea leprosula]
MGGCCSIDANFGSRNVEDDDPEERDYDGEEDQDDTRIGDGGAIVRVKGSTWFTSMYSRQGKKGINQDSLTVWENFTGEKQMFFCGVFDGHGPSGHKVARYVRDNLPLKISRVIKHSKGSKYNNARENFGNSSDTKESEGDFYRQNPFFTLWENNLTQAFEELDEELCLDYSLDSYCSGTTAVTVIKQGENLIIANLGDSRALLCTRGDKSQLVPVQLTVDLKPSLPTEAERIMNAGGRVFAMEEEPSVFRVWMPEEDCPGLAMARALGDFCLKDYGLINSPEVYFRKITSKDEFVVLATDGIWDVLTNNEVIRIVASVKNRGMAAKILVYYAVRAWRTKYPGSKVDDCAVVILFFKKRPLVAKSKSALSQSGISHQSLDSSVPQGSGDKKCDEGETVINCQIDSDNIDKLNKVNSLAKVPQLGLLSRRKTMKDVELEKAQS